MVALSMNQGGGQKGKGKGKSKPASGDPSKATRGECPKKKALNSLTAKLSEEEPAEESHVGSLQLLNAMAKSKDKEEPKPKKKANQVGEQSKGLIYVEVGINGKNTRAVVDRGATHNFAPYPSSTNCITYFILILRSDLRLSSRGQTKPRQLDSHHSIPMFYGLYRLQPIDGRHL